MLKRKIYLAYILKHDSNREKTSYFLMIPNGKGWHYLAVKKLTALLRVITSKHHGDFYCLNYLHCFTTKKLEFQKNLSQNKDFCNLNMPSEDNKILVFNQYLKSDKAPFIIYADLE